MKLRRFKRNDFDQQNSIEHFAEKRPVELIKELKAGIDVSDAKSIDYRSLGFLL